jgi:hypothetical protein
LVTMMARSASARDQMSASSASRNPISLNADAS